MNQPPNKPNLMSRLESLEIQLNRIQAIEQLAVNLRRSMTTVVEMMNAFVEEMGGAELQAKIQARLDEKRAAVRRAEAQRSGEVLKRLLESGQVEEVKVVGEDSILTCLENSLDGKIKGEQLHMAVMQFPQEIAQELIGKEVGYVLKREGKDALTVQAIYRMKDTPPPQKLTEEEAKKADETAPEAPAAPTEVKDVGDLPSAEEVATAPVAE